MIRNLAIVTILAFALAAPTAAASHWTLYYSGASSHAGATLEDDGRVVQAPGNFFNGRTNRVNYPGETPGSGGLFLDARAGSHVGAGAAAPTGVDVYVSEFVTPSGSDVLLPGIRHISAWYGAWRDTDTDGVIRDIHDGADDPEDEFTWRGIGSEVPNVAMTAYVMPRTNGAAILASTGSFLRPPAASAFGDAFAYETHTMKDRTSLANEEQSWSGAFHTNIDGGFVSSLQTVVLAGAPAATGSPLGFAIDDPAALYDVDRYDAVHPDVASLYANVVTVFRDIDTVWAANRDTIFDAQPKLSDVLALIAPTSAVVGGLIASPEETVTASYIPRDAKEPNTVEDDYGGRALFGGVGDALGRGNSYEGYADGYHLYFDNVARTYACAGAYAAVPGVIAVTQPISCQSENAKREGVSPYEWEPFGAQNDGLRSSGSAILFQAQLGLWFDRNGDTHVGNVCDASDPAEFDTDANGCIDPPRPWPHTASSTETFPICTSSDIRGGTITLTPVGGPWVGAVILRDVDEVTRVAFTPTNMEARNDASPIVLAWNDVCASGFTRAVDSNDAIMFPAGGSRVTVRVETAGTVATFDNASLGVRFENERIVDVDYLLPAM